MNTISLHSLYIAKIVVDIVLAFYTVFIYRKFRKDFSKIEYLVLCRFAVFLGFSMTYLSYLSPLIILEVAGSFLLTFASALILYYLSTQTKQPYRSHLHIGLLILYIMLYSFLIISNHSLQARLILNSGVLVLQHLLFFSDYSKAQNHDYTLIISLLVIFLLIHLGRLTNGLKHIDAIINPLSGDLFTAVALVIFVVIDIVITVNINTHLHLNKLFENLEL